MLSSLRIKDFAIVHEIAVDFDSGMTVLTGETGAGKSILVDSLGLALGERGSAQMVREGAKRAEFAAEFELEPDSAAARWLTALELDSDEHCVVRRTISADGRSRAFINGNPVTLTQLKDFGELLLDIHGQHFHQSLGRRSVQRELLDHFGGLQSLRRDVEQAFQQWHALAEEQKLFAEKVADRESRIDLLSFQLEELDALAFEENEVAELETERKRLSNSTQLAAGVERCLANLGDDEHNATDSVAACVRELTKLVDFDPTLADALELLRTADIQLQEAYDGLNRFASDMDADPGRLEQVDERLDAAYTVARKHRIDAAAIPEHHAKLRLELDEFLAAETVGKDLEENALQARKQFDADALKLSMKRQKTATAFAKAVTEAMAGLGMPGGRFEVRLASGAAPRPHGIDTIDYLISANPGQSPMALAKVASGGELARMSLAIQVIASDGSDIPTMIFDEVDSGVGGGVAEMVGLRLAELGQTRQVLSVTHLPQVASLAHNHLRVSKVSDGKTTKTGIAILSKQERVDELARMLGGVDITKKTRDHAAELLKDAARKRA